MHSYVIMSSIMSVAQFLGAILAEDPLPSTPSPPEEDSADDEQPQPNTQSQNTFMQLIPRVMGRGSGDTNGCVAVDRRYLLWWGR